MTVYDGILCVDKPSGFTSFDVIAKLRGITRTKRIGHAGTLDPMATGVLPVFFGRATKAISLLPSHDKEYIASLELGTVTDTQDSSGKIIYRASHSVTRVQFEEALKDFTGEQLQLPPMYSAVRVNGRRLYDIARSGGEIERKPREINIYALKLLDSDEEAGVYTLLAGCSGGTYVRTLCHDLGQKLGCGAVMTSLRRTKACGFALNDCVTLEEARELAGKDMLKERIMPVLSVFSHLPEFILTKSQARRFCNGLALGLFQFESVPEDGASVSVYDEAGRFLGLARADHAKGCLKIIKLFALGEDQ